MERMWRKVNHSLRNSKSQNHHQHHHHHQQQHPSSSSSSQQANAPCNATAAGVGAGAGTGVAVATPLSTDTISSAGGFGDAQLVVAVQGLQTSGAGSAAAAAGGSNATGRRLATSGGGQQLQLPAGTSCHKSLSQHVLQTRTASSERRRRRRRKSRPRRSGGMSVTSCVGDGGGDNMSSSGGFYTLKEHHQHYRHGTSGSGIVGGGGGAGGSFSSRRLFATSAPSGTVMMYPNAQRAPTLAAGSASGQVTSSTTSNSGTAAASGGAAAPPDISLRQRAVAKLRMFNFHLNWDLHMTHCKPCGPRLSGSGNIITRRLCRNRRREDNELYRSNSFKFERFERKECLEELSNTLQKQIAICDDYSLPVDFVKKRPSSFDPCLAEAIPTNPEHWIAPSPQTEFLPFTEAQQASQQPATATAVATTATTAAAAVAPPPLPAPLATLPSQQQQQQQQQHNININNNNNNTQNNQAHNNNTLPAGQQQQQQHQQQRSTLQHPPLPNSNIKQASVKLIEGYSDPKDTRSQHVHGQQQQHKKVYHKKAKRRVGTGQKQRQQQHQQQQQQQLQTLPTPRTTQQQHQQQQQRHSTYNNNNGNHRKDKRNYNSDSSAPKSSDDDGDIDEEEIETIEAKTIQTSTQSQTLLNSPDSISDDLVRPLPPQLQRSPRKLTVAQTEHSKRQPSPYYYSDLLKSRDKDKDKEREEAKQKCRQSTASEPPQQTHNQLILGSLGGSASSYRKSSSLDAPHEPLADDVQDIDEADPEVADNEQQLDESQLGLEEELLADQSTPKRYSFTEEGVHIIRCETPSTSTSEESDCSECLKRREWHARALALVRKTCNVQPRNQQTPQICATGSGSGELQLQLQHCDAGEGELLKCCPPQALQAQAQAPPPPAEASPPMPPHRLLGPAAVCGACIAAPSAAAAGIGIGVDLDEIEEYFRPRSIFYVHPHGVHECAECAPPAAPPSTVDKLTSQKQSQSINTLDLYGDDEEEEDDDDDVDDDDEDQDSDTMASRRRQIYETAFDCKISKSDDDLDEVDRITNHSVLLQLNNGNTDVKPQSRKSRLECKRAKNSKNQALQEQSSVSSDALQVQVHQVQTEMSKMQLSQMDFDHRDQQNQNQNITNPAAASNTSSSATAAAAAATAAAVAAATTTTPAATSIPGGGTTSTGAISQLPIRGYTPSPPSTAPLPMKFPGKHERYMNSIKSAPNLPLANPAHPRLRDLRLPQQLCNSSNDNSLTDSAYVNPPSTNSNSNNSAGASASASVTASVSVSASASAPNAARRPRSFVLESGRVLELRRSGGQQTGQNSHHHHHHHHHHHNHHGARRTRHGHASHASGGNGQHQASGGHNYSSTESIATSSSGGSMESLRSSTSEGNRSTSSSESRHSSSLSSHSSESGSCSSSVAYPLRPPPLLLHSKLHILSPISDKSSQEPASEQSQQQQQQQQQQGQTQEEGATAAAQPQLLTVASATGKQQRRSGGSAEVPPNKALLHLADEFLGSDSGISLHSREDGKPLPAMAMQRLTLPKLQLIGASDASNPSGSVGGGSNAGSSGVAGAATGGGGGGGTSASSNANAGLPQELRDLPFDMPKLRRRKTLQQEAACTSGSATSVDLGELPFDMPKLRRRLRANQAEINNLMMHSTESSGISQASSSHSMRCDDPKMANKLDTALFRQNLTLNLNEPRQAAKQFGSLDLRGLNSNKELNINLCQGYVTAVDLIEVTIPLERQGWYHGAITRIEAETTLRPLAEGSFLVRNCESTKQDYSLSLKGAKGFMHMRIQRNEAGQYILGQFSRPFETVPDMIRHFCLNRLPVRGAEHMCLIEPVIAQLL
ncbi:LOW QUALITY PROTEIN: uncharacterized protein hwt [Drosophila tropicalis]|uniref:LOW QUALITY PROTEIN: uncharacterized protein hwt n=1 Tax=Drosophila tropicalis TaxID=46794 RepID=UPI0035ABE75F